MRHVAFVTLFVMLLAPTLAGPAVANGPLYVVVERTAATGEVLPLKIRSATPGSVLVRAWRVQAPEALLDAGVRLDRGETLSWLAPSAVGLESGQAELRARASLRPALVGTPLPVAAQKVLDVDLRLVEPGLYLVAVHRGRETAYVTAVVSDLGLVVKRSGSSLLAWAVHRATGTPWPGATVSVRADDGRRLEAVAGPDGLCLLEGAVPARARVRAMAAGHLAFGRATSYAAAPHDRRVYLHTNQPAYRPGERVEVRGIVRALDAGRLALDTEARTVTVRLASPDGTVAEEVEAVLSLDMGTFSAGFDLDELAATGDWNVVAVVAGREYAAPLVVDAYRKPAFEVSVRPAAPRALVGSPSAFRVSASFYDGGVPAGAKVTWQLLYHRVDRELFPEDDLVRLFFGTEREAYRPETLATGDGVLDAAGGLDVPVTVPAERPDGYLSLRATVFGPDRMTVAASGRLAVVASPLRVALEADRHLLGPEDTVRVRVRVERADGRPAANRSGVLTVALAPETGPGVTRAETWLHSLPFRTDARGEASLEAPLAAAGRYALAVAVPRAADEPAGPPAHAELHVWAVGTGATPGTPGAGLEIIADKDHYVVGDEARLLVRTPGGSRPVLATVEGDALLSKHILGTGGQASLLTLRLDDTHVPNVFVTFTTVDHGRLIAQTRVLRIPPRTRLLDVGVTPDAAELDPGQGSGLTVTVRGPDGRAAAGAEVAVAVVDQALFALHADPGAPIEAFFHPPRRNAVTTTDLLQWASVGYAVPPPPPPSRRGGGGGRSADPSAPAEDAAPAGAMPPPMPSPSAQPMAPGSAAPEPVTRDEEALDEAGVEMEESENGHLGFTSPEMDRLAAKEAKSEGPGAVTVREDFRTSIFWEPHLRTDAQGVARVEEVRYGDSLTQWRLSATAVDASTRVGRGEARVRTRRKVSVRLTLPRFLRSGDLVQAPLVLRNLTGEALAAQWELRADGATDAWRRAGTLELPAGGTQVLEQQIHAGHVGLLPFTARLTTPAGGDAERRDIPVQPQGIEKVVGASLLATGGSDSATFTVPGNAEAGTITCAIRLEPGFASAMTNALPYLLDYPYGCTEQTMSRFVPLLAAAEALDTLGRGEPGRASELPDMIDAGLKRLAALRHADGGYGWWEHDTTDIGMTALVVRGLSRLVDVVPEHEVARTLRDGAAEALAAHLSQHGKDLDATTHASALLAMARAGRLQPETMHLVSASTRGAASPLARALYLRAAVAVGRQDLIQGMRGLLDDEARRQDDYVFWSTAAPGSSPEGPTRWQDDEIETTAVVLRALLEAGVRPDVLNAGARWLLMQRHGGDRWRSTRDTGAAVEFLAAYATKTRESGAGRQVTLSLGDTVLWQGALTLEQAGEVLALAPEQLAPGARGELHLACPDGTASASVALRYYETGPAIRAAANGFRVRRSFQLLEPVEADGKVTWTRVPLAETLPSGALVECEVTIETDRPREYVMVTSPHAAGFEPAREVGMTIEGRGPATEARRDGRDDRTMFFVTRLAPGTAVFRHLLRATHVGNFTALPAQAELMYFPDVRGNSDGDLWQITPAGPLGRAGGRDGR